MAESGGATKFPVKFFNGEREFHVGDILIQPHLAYNTLRYVLAERIGISPDMISIYLADKKTGRIFLLTCNTSFPEICMLTKDWCFFVLLNSSFMVMSSNTTSFYNQIAVPERETNYSVGMAAKSYMEACEEENRMLMPKKFCEECSAARKEGKTAGFHNCPNHVVVKGCRPAGAGNSGQVHR